MKFRSLTVFSLVLATLGFSAALLSQAPTATISGTIFDESKALIPGVAITAVEEKSGKSTTTISDGRGKYSLANLPSGNYTVSAALRGFATGVKELAVTAPEQRSLDFTLKVDVRGDGFLLPPAGPRGRDLRFRADSTTVQGLVTHYKGNVEMTTDSVIVRADELDFNSATQQADARGNVRIQVLPVTAKVRPLTN